MKTLRIFPFVALLMMATTISFAQKTKSETFKVSGNCGMCKTKIEKAAKDAGASFAAWDVEKKEITVKYNSSSTNTAKIQKQIAAVGYDNVGAKTTEDVYNKLHGCCKYDRAASAKASCCSEGSSCSEDHSKMDCCKDGKCTKEGHDGKDCCKDGKCTKEGHEGKDCCKKDGAMDCCKDGKCTMEGHDGKDCCKKSH